MYVNHNVEACSCNHCCSGKSTSIAYSDCVFVDLGIHHAMCIHHIVICGLPGCTLFFHIDFIKCTIKKNYSTYNVFLFSLQLLYETFLILKRTEQDIGLFCIKLKFSLQIF